MYLLLLLLLFLLILRLVQSWSVSLCTQSFQLPLREGNIARMGLRFLRRPVKLCRTITLGRMSPALSRRLAWLVSLARRTLPLSVRHRRVLGVCEWVHHRLPEIQGLGVFQLDVMCFPCWVIGRRGVSRLIVARGLFLALGLSASRMLLRMRREELQRVRCVVS
jgi:hypothetical protein